MKALSLLQPWAQLVVSGQKRFETRSWATTYRGRLLIHASKRFGKHERSLTCEPLFYDAATHMKAIGSGYPLGAIVGEVTLVACIGTDDWLLAHTKPESAREFAFGDYSHGRYAWKLIDAVEYEQPVPAKGSLGIWEFAK